MHEWKEGATPAVCVVQSLATCYGDIDGGPRATYEDRPVVYSALTTDTQRRMCYQVLEYFHS